MNFIVKKEEIIEIFDDLDKKIKDKIDITKLNANLSAEKIQTFKNSTNQNIKDALEQYKIIVNKNDFSNVDESIITSINGELIVSSKSSFTDNDIPNINFDTIYSQHIANNKIKYFLPNSFLLARTDKYLIERKQVISGFERVIKDVKNKIIVAIRPRYESKKMIDESKFKDILVEIPSTNNDLNDTFFILDKKDLPIFESKDLPQNVIDKFSLTLLDENCKYKIYSNVIDINLPENIALKEEYSTKDEKELKVLILILFIFLIKWKKDRKITMLSLTSPFQERGIVNTLEDLKELKTSK